jgi:Ca2+-binding EF-hand superfamily protein
LNVSHALVPFAIDLRHDPVLGAVLGWRDPLVLFVASQSLASQVGTTDVDLGALERIFSLADGNSDGQLTTAELLAIVNLPLTQLASTIDAQIIAALENVLQSLALTATFDALALASMRILDPDKTGTVNVSEFTQFVTAFVRNGHSVRSPGNIDEGGTRLIDLFMLIDGRDAISQHGESARHRPFTLLFLNVERGDLAIYKANDFPAFVRFDPPKQTLSTMEFEFFNARLNRQYDFKGLENQLIFEIDHGRRSTASERSRAPDGTYTLLPPVSGSLGALQPARARTQLSPSSEYDDDDGVASSPCSYESSDYEDGM